MSYFSMFSKFLNLLLSYGTNVSSVILVILKIFEKKVSWKFWITLYIIDSLVAS
jgi:hypothetical protein